MNPTLDFLRAVSLTALALGVCGVAAQAQTISSFTQGDLVIYRVGSGAAGLTSASTAVFLDEYTQAGTFVGSYTLPSANTGTGTHNLTASGTATSEGMLNLSGDGQYLAVPGYDATAGTTGIAGTSSATVPRTIDVIGGNGAISSVTDLNAFTGNNIRSAYTTDGSSVYAVGNGNGVVYATAGATSFTTISSTATNLRDVNVSNGQLYVSTGSGSTLRIGTVGTGTPTTTGQTITNLPGFETTGSPYQFFFTTLNGGTSPDTLYVADDTSTTGGIQKWSFSSGAWTLNNTIVAANLRGLTGFAMGTSVTLYATSGGTGGATGGGSLYTLTDTSGFNAPNNGTANNIATVATNETFRGIAFAPQLIAGGAAPEPGVLPLLAEVGALAVGFGLIRRRKA